MIILSSIIMNATELINSLPDKQITRIMAPDYGELWSDLMQTGLAYGSGQPLLLKKYKEGKTLVFRVASDKVAIHLLARTHRIIIIYDPQDKEAYDYIAEQDNRRWKLTPIENTDGQPTTADYDDYLATLDAKINELLAYRAEIEDMRFEVTRKSPAKRPFD